MTVSSGAFLKGVFNATAALGDKVISSDAIMEIAGYEELGMLTKQFPWPVLATGGEIEVPMPLGLVRWQPQQAKINQQGSMTFMESKQGHIARFMEEILIKGARFDAKVYEGTPTEHTRMLQVFDCFFQADNPDRDWENRAQIMTITGTLFYHYLGDYK